MRRIGRVVAWTALVALAGTLMLLVWARSPSGRRKILSVVVSRVQRRLDGRLAVGRLEGGLIRDLVLHDVRIYDSDGELAVSAGEIDAEYSLRGLVSRRVRIHSLVVKDAWVHARTRPDGELNLARLAKPQDQDGSFEIAIDALHGQAEIVFEDRRGSLELDGRAKLAPEGDDLTLDRLAFATDGARLEASGALHWDPVAPRLHDLRVHLHSDGIDRWQIAPFDATLYAGGRREALTAELVVTPPQGELRMSAQASLPLAGPLTWTATATAHDLELRPEASIELSARGDGDQDGGSVAIESLKVSAPGAHATAQGTLAFGASLAADLRAEVSAADLALLAPGVHGKLEARAHLRKGSTTSSVDATVSARRLRVGELRVSSLDAQLQSHNLDGQATLNALGVDVGQMHLSSLHARAHGVPLPDEGRWAMEIALDTLTLGDQWRLSEPGRIRLDRRELQAQLALGAAEERLALDGTVDRDSGRLEVAVKGRSLDAQRVFRNLPSTQLDVDLQLGGTRAVPELAAKLNGRIRLESLRSRLPPSLRSLSADAWLSAELNGTPRKLELHAHGSTSEGDVTLDAGYQNASANGTLSARWRGGELVTAHAEADLRKPWREAPLTVDATVPSYDLSRLPKLAGTVSGTAQVRGTLAHPIGQADLRAQALRVAEQRIGQLDAHAGWDGETLTAKLDSNALHFDARVPADAGQPMQATLQARELAIALSDLGSLRKLEGKVTSDLHLSGPRAHARLNGSLKIDRGAFAAGNDPRLYEDLTVDLVAHDGKIQLERLALNAGDGKVSAHGTFTLDGLDLSAVDVVADAERFPFHQGNARAWVDVRAELQAQREGQTLRGKLLVSQGSAHLPTRSPGKNLRSTRPLEDVVFVDEPPAPPSERVPFAADVVAHIPGPFQVRSQELTADLKGKLDVRIADGEVRLYGHAETASGRVELLGRRYQIERARVSFDGRADPDPALDVRITRQVSDTTVVIELHGTLKNPDLVLASDLPIYDSSQVIGAIISGDPDNLRVGPGKGNPDIAGALSGVLVSRIVDGIAPGLPIDVIKVDTGGSFGGIGRARLEVGKYLSERVYISYVHQFGSPMSGLHRENSSEANVEFRFRRHYTLEVRYGDAGAGSINLSWTLRR